VLLRIPHLCAIRGILLPESVENVYVGVVVVGYSAFEVGRGRRSAWAMIDGWGGVRKEENVGMTAVILV